MVPRHVLRMNQYEVSYLFNISHARTLKVTEEWVFSAVVRMPTFYNEVPDLRLSYSTSSLNSCCMVSWVETHNGSNSWDLATLMEDLD